MSIIVLYDTLHGEFHLSSDVLLLFNTSVVQRMSRIVHRAFASTVYPAMTYSQLAQSLGSYCVAQRLLNSLESRDKRFTCPKGTRDEILVATLFRNVGRGPFGEFWDQMCVRNIDCTPPYDSKEYRRRSASLFRKVAREVLPHWTVERVSRVVDLIYPIRRGMHTWCYDVISYAKKFDAVLRDAQLANIDHSFCLESIIRSARTASYAFYHIAFDEVQLSELFRVREVLRHRVYQHPQRIGLFLTLTDALYCNIPYYYAATYNDVDDYFLDLDDSSVVAHAQPSPAKKKFLDNIGYHFLGRVYSNDLSEYDISLLQSQYRMCVVSVRHSSCVDLFCPTEEDPINCIESWLATVTNRTHCTTVNHCINHYPLSLQVPLCSRS